jgi:hypothetical protein
VSYRTPAERDGDTSWNTPPTQVLRLEKSWWQLGHTRLELDAAEEEIRATPVASFGSSQTLTWLVRKVERACTILDDDAADALALVVDGEPKLLANGSKASCDAAVVEIDRFLASLRDARAVRARVGGTSNAPFADWSDLEDEEKWERMEAFLSRVPVDERRLERSDEDLVLHAKKGGFAFRLLFDALDPLGFEIELDAPQSFVVTELTFDPSKSAEGEPVKDPTWERVEGRTYFGKHVYTHAAAEAFLLIPEELRAKICATMEEEHIEHLRFGTEVTELSCPQEIREVAEPVARVLRVVDLIVECAHFLTTGTSR